MVPMAPSSTRMRSRAAARKAIRASETGTVIVSRRFLRARGANTEQMTDRKHQVRAVHRIKVEGIDAVLVEFLHLARDDGCRHQLAGLGVVIEAFEFFRKPIRHRGARAGHKTS